EKLPHFLFTRMPWPQVERQRGASHFVVGGRASLAAVDFRSDGAEHGTVMIDDGGLPACSFTYRDEAMISGVVHAIRSPFESHASVGGQTIERGVEGVGGKRKLLGELVLADGARTVDVDPNQGRIGLEGIDGCRSTEL